MTLEQLFELKATKVAESLYVIVAERRDGTKLLLQDPGMGKPWSSRNKKLADSHAAEIQGRRDIAKAGAMPLAEAFMVLQQDFASKQKHLPNG